MFYHMASYIAFHCFKTIWDGRVPVAKVLDCNFKVSEFELQSPYYVYFQTNTLRKGMNPLHP